MDEVEKLVDKLYKECFGQLVASLLFASRDIDPQTAEDIAQDSFSAALINWRESGIPLNPRGWVYKVCKNKTLNLLQRQKKTVPLTENEPRAKVEARFSESVLDDQSLKLLFACAHPHLAPKIQVVITLKYVANLKVEAIAKALAMTIDGVDKLLLRARERIKDEKILLHEPDRIALNARLVSVHKVLYLIFNEGYKASWGPEILRKELCEEALLTTKSLLESPLANQETAALYAMMLFNSARLKSRFDADGELIDLENQDRNRWSRELIELGRHFFEQAQGPTLSTYHIEASIAYLHCTSATFQHTDWGTISQLYARLLRLQHNPFVELNFAIALYYAGHKKQSFKQLHDLLHHPFMSKYYLLHSALGKLYYLEGDGKRARDYFTKALLQVDFEKEKTFIQKMIDRI